MSEPVELVSDGRPWRAAVSSFGISGTNAHVIVEAPPEPPAPLTPSAGSESPAASEKLLTPVLVSGGTKAALREQAGRLADWLEREGRDVPLPDVARTLALSRAALDHRAVVVGDDRESVVAGLRAAMGDSKVISGAGGVVLVFPGQGWQWAGMARELLAVSPVFADRLTECDKALAAHVDWSVTDVLLGDDDGWLSRVDVVQPVLWATMVSLGAVWLSWGLPVMGVVGHSQGEVAAACVAGGLSLADGARVVVVRSRLVRELAGTGGMASVGLSRSDIEPQLPEGVEVAVVNSGSSTVIAGPVPALETLVESWTGQGVRARLIPVDYASHSAAVDAVGDRIISDLDGLTPQPSSIPLVSTVTGEILDTAGMDATYWLRNLRQTVRFDTAMQTQIDRGARVFVEVSAHPVLELAMAELVEAAAVPGVVVPSQRRDRPQWQDLLSAAGRVWTAGVTVDWATILGAGQTRADLPTYAFQHRRFWLTPPTTAGEHNLDHPVLTGITRTTEDEPTVFTGRVDRHTLPWLDDHAVNRTTLIPGTALVEWLIRTGDELGHNRIAELTIHTPLTLEDQTGRHIHVVCHPTPAGDHTARLYSRSGPTDLWTEHAEAVLSTAADGVPADGGDWPPAGPQPLPLDSFYADLAAVGYEYGPTFQGLRQAWQRGDTLYAEITLPTDEPDRHGIHPALLDAALHPLLLADDHTTTSLRVPFGWAGVQLYATGARSARVTVTRTGPDTATVRLADDDGRAIAHIDELRLRALPAGALSGSAAASLSAVTWVPAATTEDDAGTVVLGDGYADVPALVEAVRAGASVPATITFTAEVEDADPADAVTATLTVVQQFIAAPELNDVRLRIVTSGANVAPGGHTDIRGVTSAALWGLIRVAQSEFPGRINIIDVPAGGTVPALTEEQAIVRAEGVLVPRLTTVTPAAAEAPSLDNGWVLVTGGTGGIAALLSEHLVRAHGVRKLLLVSRSGPDAPGAGELTQRLETLGATVRVAACDVADRTQLQGVLDGIDRLVGVIHAAGVLDDGVLEGLSAERVANVLRGKLGGALLLHELTAGRDLALFVMFSSIAGVLGNAGQGAYAAANAGLDGLAVHRRESGLPGTSVAWGLWEAETGMTRGLSQRDRGRFAGLAMPTGEALALFDAALTSTEPVVVAARLDRTSPHPLITGRSGRRPGRRTITTATAKGQVNEFAGLSLAQRQRRLRDLVRAHVAGVLGHGGPEAVDLDRPFKEVGFDSLTAVDLRNRLAAAVGKTLPATVVFDHPTPIALARHLDEVLGGEPVAAPVPVAPPAHVTAAGDSLAIVGMACRFPGGVDSPEDLWRVVVEGRDVVGDFPADRGWTVDGSFARVGGFLDAAAHFDAELFGISPREALAMDPQQRLLLEVSWEALERAGIAPDSLRGSPTGVFVGVIGQEYGPRLGEAGAQVEGYGLTGGAVSVASGRIAYVLGLEGPAMSVDTACSSSLVALHLAGQALRAGECDLALVGGVTVMASPGLFVEFDRQGGLAGDGRC
ncbi:SDR family NAD(P)-dependent oxidoreductase, partial [Micromonospora sp. NPDC047730]|uniref:SDR family NAD(P)-dependent oxidoreductase n=1 Tax=Micromonospora sp. NPDC047730 TaxID=3364253 RepID=UPI003715DE0C